MKILFLTIFLITKSIFACSDSTEDTKKSEFVANSSKTFLNLNDESMRKMDANMMSVSRQLNIEQYFLQTMVAHHQGAVDMASALLIHSKNKEIINLSKLIISEQTSEINLMKIMSKNLSIKK